MPRRAIPIVVHFIVGCSTTKQKACTRFWQAFLMKWLINIQSLILNIPKSEVLMGGEQFILQIIALGNKLGVQTLTCFDWRKQNKRTLGSHQHTVNIIVNQLFWNFSWFYGWTLEIEWVLKIIYFLLLMIIYHKFNSFTQINFQVEWGHFPLKWAIYWSNNYHSTNILVVSGRVNFLIIFQLI